MEVQAEIAPLEFTKIVLVVFGCVLPANLIKVDQEALFCATFDDKSSNLKYLAKFLSKKIKSI